MILPESYKKRLEETLSDAKEYFSVMNDAPVTGLSVNTLKITAEAFASAPPFPLEDKVPWAENGFYIREEKPGKSPFFEAGLFYVQEPSAMCAVPLLDVNPGEKVLDLCSAPGGKGTQIAEKMRGEGILVLNEKIPDRAAILSSNVERAGIRNAVVTNSDPEILALKFENYFDKILVDAPCSGEGMFRKEPAALENWSESNVQMCAQRQAKILDSAAKMLRAGGKMVYSTCTFSEDEDEKNVERFLACHREFRLLKAEKLWPHRVRGEGHFAALLEKTDGESKAENKSMRTDKPAEKRIVERYRAFERGFLLKPLSGKFLQIGSALYLVPEELFSLDRLKFLRAGIRLGELKGDRFEPAHSLVMAANRKEVANLSDYDEEEILNYFKGEIMPSRAENGWCAVSVKGYPVGLGKISGGVVKNHFPKGLRHN